MGKTRTFISLITAVTILLTVLTASAAFAEPGRNSSVANYGLIVLTPGHSRTIYYVLDNAVLMDLTAFQATFITTLGAGILNVSVANSSFVGDNSEIVYGTAGFIGSTPVIDYSYSSGVIVQSIEVPDFSVGLLFTGVLYGVGNPEFPVTMSMTFSLL